MARKIEKLTALSVSRAKKRGYLADGGGLYLQISPSGAKSWVFRYRNRNAPVVRKGPRKGKARDKGLLCETGLGPVHTVSLAKARERAREYRNLLLDGIDPIAEREAGQLRAKLEAARSMTFEQCAVAYIEAHKGSWKNDKHAAQWPSTLETYAYPVFGDLSVQSIDVALVTKALEPIWKTKTETASRLRGRIERVLDWATVRG
jgi:hypothetical protein